MHHPDTRRRRLLAAALISATVAPLPYRSASAQSFPERPIRILVGFPPGTATDTIARLLSQRLNETKGWNVVVENRPGVSGSLGAAEIVRATPDGYNLLLSAAGPLATNPNLYKEVTYDTARDFTPIALVADISYVIVVAAKSPANTIGDLISMAKERPGQLNFGSVGMGSTQHLIASTFLRRAGVTMAHVPYKGSVDVMAGAVSGDIAFYVDSAVAAAPQVTAGRLRALGVTSARRVSNMPDLQTLDEQGLKGFDMPNWLALMGPAGLPAPVLATLHGEVNGLVRSTAMRERMVKLGTEPRGDKNPEELAAFIRNELAKWKQALEVSGAKSQ